MDKPTKDAPAAKPAPDSPAAPVQEYPKALYHADGSTKTVANKDEEAAATKAGYQDTPPGPPAESRRRE